MYTLCPISDNIILRISLRKPLEWEEDPCASQNHHSSDGNKNKNLVLYAKWEKNTSVRFGTYGGWERTW
jgi:hypothetical protein